MDRAEAEAIYDAGREVVVEVLLRMDEEIRRLVHSVPCLDGTRMAQEPGNRCGHGRDRSAAALSPDPE